MSERCPLPPIEELKEERGVEIVEHRFGPGWIREYLDRDDSLQGVRNVRELEYVTADGKRWFFSTIVPEGFLLLRWEGEGGADSYRYGGIRYIGYEDRILIPYSDERERLQFVSKPYFETPFALLELLHEVGHARQEFPDEEEKRRLILREKADAQRGLSPLEKKEFVEKVLAEERDAWAYALRQLEKLREEGIDLAPQLKTREEVLAFVHTALLTYEGAVRDSRWLKERIGHVRRAFIAHDPTALIHEAIRPRRER